MGNGFFLSVKSVKSVVEVFWLRLCHAVKSVVEVFWLRFCHAGKSVVEVFLSSLCALPFKTSFSVLPISFHFCS